MEGLIAVTGRQGRRGKQQLGEFKLLAPEFSIKILAHSVCKMRIIQEPKKVAL
jgi:hypothetical protein